MHAGGRRGALVGPPVKTRLGSWDGDHPRGYDDMQNHLRSLMGSGGVGGWRVSAETGQASADRR